MKSGTVALVGRPNVGKSTLVNTIVGQKVAITSPKPQTTRFPIHAYYTDERGEIVFIDTPGIFAKAKDLVAKKTNAATLSAIESNIDVFLYIVDPTRKREYEEGRVLGIVRKIKKPVIMVFNKMDVQDPEFLPQYEFLKEEFDEVFYVSASERKHIKPLLDRIFELLPERGIEPREKPVYPALNLDGGTFLAELIREKLFLQTRKEIPYTATVVVDEIDERENGILYIKARILTTDLIYKKMIIGQQAKKIKVIGSMARTEIETSTNKHVFLDLTVDIDKHWMETSR
ncbi:MAG: GTPase Era [Microgenomates bacterium OLB22]|nr:MAG: GTPase Era [Microgenomates bacterium OLB22]